MSNNLKEKRWELLPNMKKDLEDLYFKSNNNSEVKDLIDNIDKLRELKDNIKKQDENLKLRSLISSRERNVLLEKLRNIETFCEDKNWEDSENVMKDIYSILYKN